MLDSQIRKTRSAKTARARRRLSAPAEWLLKQDRLCGRILDFGCGQGDIAKFLDGDIEQWDPNWYPKKPRGKFDVVTCLYVLNVLRPGPRRAALRVAKGYVRRGGALYIAVRRDELGPARWGAEQHVVHLQLPSILHRKGRFEIYEWKNN